MEACLSFLCDKIATPVCQWLCLKESYIHNLPENLSSLENAIEVLKAKRDDVQTRVDREEFAGSQRRLAQVEVWLNNVLTIEKQVNDLLSTNKVELQRLCLCSFCSKNVKQSYRYGKNVFMMLKEVESHNSEKGFDVVTEAVHVAQAEELPIQPIIVGQETLFERVRNHLMEDEVGIVGLYGMGGVGKTTLLKQINNMFTKIGGRFEVVIWVVVSNGATIHKIQGNIGEKLGLRGEDWDQKNESERAITIHNILRKQTFVLILDDIWEKVNLEAVGVPNPNTENKCKIAFTTRSIEVCARMGVENPIEVTCLDAEKSWELFEKKVGAKTLGVHPDILELAKKIARKCRGLPLALNVIGETMACKTTIQEWHHAVDILTKSAIKFSDMENKILPILKYSYDNLSGDENKSCFLYCSLFPEDYKIEKKRLIEYWICEGFIDEKQGIERALNEGYAILGTLVRACLLFEGTNNTCLLFEGTKNKSTVSMHDVIREMAMWITSDLGKHKNQCIVQAGVGLREVPKVENWEVVNRISLMENEIQKIVDSHECPQLTTLLLNGNHKLVNISGEFFLSMPKLLVLDLSMSFKLDEVPYEVSELVFLRYLDLSGTKIKQLPFGLQSFKMLIHLNLERMINLESLIGVSNFSSLRVIRLQYSEIMFDMSLMKEFELLEHLEYITINISPRMVGEQWLYNSRVGRCIQGVCITEFPKESVRILILPTMVNLSHVHIENCAMREIKIEKTIWNTSHTKGICFSNLSFVQIINCDGVKDLTWLLLAPNLTRLKVCNLKEVKSLISKEKAAKFLEEGETCISIIPFQKLELLVLGSLPALKSIYWNSLLFPCLTQIVVTDCDDLMKLPLDSKSVVNVEEFKIIYRTRQIETKHDWIGCLEWEDEATRLRFLPSLRTYAVTE